MNELIIIKHFWVLCPPSKSGWSLSCPEDHTHNGTAGACRRLRTRLVTGTWAISCTIRDHLHVPNYEEWVRFRIISEVAVRNEDSFLRLQSRVC